MSDGILYGTPVYLTDFGRRQLLFGAACAVLGIPPPLPPLPDPTAAAYRFAFMVLDAAMTPKP